MIQKINHVSITVKNLDQVVNWFRDVLGCTNIWEPEGMTLELVQAPG
jgi:catechol 2,3-dioxygenase-like lactoylglutathione lyase family enzyme